MLRATRAGISLPHCLTGAFHRRAGGAERNPPSSCGLRDGGFHPSYMCWGIIPGAATLLEVFGSQPCVSGYPGERNRPDFHIVMKRENVVRPTGSLQRTMGTGLPFDAPPEPLEGSEDQPRLSG